MQKDGFVRTLFLSVLAIASCCVHSVSGRELRRQAFPAGQSAITYEFSGGRFGDSLLAYMHALWISYISGLPLLYRPFPLSEQLVLHAMEQRYTYPRGKLFKEIILLKYRNGFCFADYANILYEVPYFPYDVSKEPEPHYFPFPIDWNNKEFKNELKRVIRPRFPVAEMTLPTDRITVAVHIRRGGSFEKLNLGAPHKFPDDSYYKEQLRFLDKLLQHKPLYVFLFTDDREPLKILQDFQHEFATLPHICFDCRKTENDHNMNVIEDFFALTKFNCLIRPESNFSICAAKISDYLVEISPKTWKVCAGKALVKEAEVYIDRELCEQRGLMLEQKASDKA